MIDMSKWKKVKSLSHVWLFVSLLTVACQSLPYTGFSRQEYWSGLPFPSPGIFLTQGSNSGVPHYRQTIYHLRHQGSSKTVLINVYNLMSLKTTLPCMTVTTIYSRNINCFSVAVWEQPEFPFELLLLLGSLLCLELLTIHCSFFWNDFWHIECPLKP